MLRFTGVPFILPLFFYQRVTGLIEPDASYHNPTLMRNLYLNLGLASSLFPLPALA